MTDILRIARGGPTKLSFARQESDPQVADDLDSRSANFFEFRDVCKAFDERPVLDHVSFTVKQGETCVIMGRSGVGKSVTLKHLMGFLKADSGRVIIDGEDVTDYTEEQFAEVRRKVTMVFQSGALFDSLTVRENISFPLDGQPGLTAKDVDEYVAKIAHMLEVEHVLDKPPSELSTGMKRAVAIGRAFAQNPEAILYDEPTTMVDPLMAHLLGDLIKKLKKQLKLTSIVVTHDMALAKKLADRLVFLHEARVIFFGTFAEMARSKEPIVQEFLELDSLDFEAYFGAQRPPHAARP